MINIVIPFGISFQEWVNRLAITFPTESIPLPPNVKFWWGWAENFRLNPFFSISPVPDKKIYKTEQSWSLWAEDFILLYSTK
jgi:hypothetical protein